MNVAIQTVTRTELELLVRSTADAIAFYTEAFDAVETQRGCLPDGQPIEAELAIGEYRLWLTEWCDEASFGRNGPDLLRYPCDDCTQVLGRAVAAGAEIQEGCFDLPEGVVVRDPAGQRWIISPR